MHQKPEAPSIQLTSQVVGQFSRHFGDEVQHQLAYSHQKYDKASIPSTAVLCQSLATAAIPETTVWKITVDWERAKVYTYVHRRDHQVSLYSLLLLVTLIYSDLALRVWCSCVLYDSFLFCR